MPCIVCICFCICNCISDLYYVSYYIYFHIYDTGAGEELATNTSHLAIVPNRDGTSIHAPPPPFAFLPCVSKNVADSSRVFFQCEIQMMNDVDYPLVNIQKAIENGHL